MSRFKGAVILAIGLAAGAAGGYWYARPPANPLEPATASQTATAAERHVLYYRDSSGAPYWSAIPKKDANGRDFLPVYEGEEVSFDPIAKKPQSTAAGSRRILYYRNPMGLPDTSPVPKKDWMGMDYIAVYEGEEQEDRNTVKVSLDKVQRSGVRTEKVQSRAVVRPVRAVGTMKTDENRVTVVAMRTEGYIEELFVSRTGQHVEAGEPLFRVYSSQIQQAQTDLLVAIHAQGASSLLGPSSLEGAMQRLRNLGVPESRIREVRAKGVNPRTVDWPAPASGHVIEKRVINGQRVMPGDELYRIADYSRVWVIADVSEADMAFVGIGTHAVVTFRSYPSEPVEGEVTLIYPELKPETRTGRVRIELPNPGGRLKVDMYADVVFQDGAGEQFLAIPDSAVIDSGTRQIVLVARGEGRFEPRLVKLGPRGNGYIAILDGLTEGEEIVTAATFLIDAESNLRAALNAFAQQETKK
jgi:Cu(I)/Ag(I) efflux system membrane fusion protein